MSFAPEYRRGLIARGTTEGDRAAEQSNGNSEEHDDEQDEDGRTWCDTKNVLTDHPCEQNAQTITDRAAGEGKKQLFSREQETRRWRSQPRALSSDPISVRRSMTDAADDAPTARPAASSDANVTSQSSVRTRVRMRPSPSATRRITRTSEPGSTCLNRARYGGNVRRAAPALEFVGLHRGRIASGEVVFGLG